MRLSGLLYIAGVISYMTHMATLSGGSGMGAHPVVLAYSEQVSFKLELTFTALMPNLAGCLHSW